MPQERVRESTIKTRSYGWLPFGSNLTCGEKTDGSDVHHHALNACDSWRGQLLRIKNPAGLPAVIASYVHPANFHRAQARSDSRAKRVLIAVENDGDNTSHEKKRRLTSGTPGLWFGCQV